MSTQRTVPVAGPPAVHAMPGSDADLRRAARRRRMRQVMRLTADGTGRTEAEVQWLVVATGVSILRAGALAASFGVLRLINFMVDA